MPFAPMVLEEDYEDLFTDPKEKITDSLQFMTVTANSKPQLKQETPGVVHIDGTARPQVLTSKNNPDCYEIVKNYKKRTGLRAIINTSFNIHNEPIVCTEEDALRTFIKSEVDYLFLEEYEIPSPSLVET